MANPFNTGFFPPRLLVPSLSGPMISTLTNDVVAQCSPLHIHFIEQGKLPPPSYATEIIKMTGNSVIEMNGTPSDKSDEVVAKLKKEQLKSLFYLFSGKPDSRIKVFNKALYIEKDDIIELNDCITRKLKIHNIDSQITSVNIGYIGADIHEFGTWDEFTSHHWQHPECVEEVVIKWDFMVSLQTYEFPQRHTLLVRISSDMKPGKILQMLASGNSDEFDKVDVMTAPAFCRVDFINAQISKELINEVSDWFKGRRKPALIPDSFYWIRKRRQGVAEIIHMTTHVVFGLLWLSLLLWIDTNKYAGQISLQHTAIWLFAGLTLLTPINKIGHMLASRVYSALDELEGNRVVFEFTTGDKKKNSELLQSNKDKGKKFIKETAWSLLTNIASGVIATYLYTNS